MRAPLTLLAALLPVVATGAALAAVAMNRAGGREPIVLTQREAAVSARGPDDSAATISLLWQSPVPRANWLTCDRLQELGFDCSVDAAAPGAERHYQRQLPREVYVAFELDGPAWQALLAAQDRAAVASGQQPYDGLRTNGSRLVAIDAARDGDVLARRYPNAATHLIAAATVAIRRVVPEKETPYVMGAITGVLPQRIHVPRAFAAALPARRGVGERPPFTIALRYGRRFEPWVVDTR